MQLKQGEKTFDVQRFEKQINEYGITHAFFFPTFVENHFRSENELRILAILRYWIVGAEKLPKSLMDKALKVNVRIIQIYGLREKLSF